MAGRLASPPTPPEHLVYLLTLLAKNERRDLSQGEIAALRKLVGVLVETYGG